MLSIELNFKSNGVAPSMGDLVHMIAVTTAKIMRKEMEHLIQGGDMSPWRGQLNRAYGIPEAAKFLGISPWTLRKWIGERRVPSLKLGKRVMISREAIDRILSEGIQTQ